MKNYFNLKVSKTNNREKWKKSIIIMNIKNERKMIRSLNNKIMNKKDNLKMDQKGENKERKDPGLSQKEEYTNVVVLKEIIRAINLIHI